MIHNDRVTELGTRLPMRGANGMGFAPPPKRMAGPSLGQGGLDILSAGPVSFALNGLGVYVGWMAGLKLKGVPSTIGYVVAVVSALRLVNDMGKLASQ